MKKGPVLAAVGATAAVSTLAVVQIDQTREIEDLRNRVAKVGTALSTTSAALHKNDLCLAEGVTIVGATAGRTAQILDDVATSHERDLCQRQGLPFKTYQEALEAGDIVVGQDGKTKPKPGSVYVNSASAVNFATVTATAAQGSAVTSTAGKASQTIK